MTKPCGGVGRLSSTRFWIAVDLLLLTTILQRGDNVEGFVKNKSVTRAGAIASIVNNSKFIITGENHIQIIMSKSRFARKCAKCQ